MSRIDPIDIPKVSSPCTADWDSMSGNDQVRFCQHCNLSVHNLSSVTRKQALRLIKRSQGRLCVRYLLDLSESSETGSTTRSLYRIGRRASRIAAGAFSATLTVSGAAASNAPFDRSILGSELAGRLKDPSPLSYEAGLGGAIRGIVFDPNGAVIVGARVSLSSHDDKLAISTVTNGDGEYRFDGLKAGEYALKFEAAGFASSEVKGIGLRDDHEDRIDQTLGVATVEAEVEIQSSERVLMGAAALPVSKDPLVRAAQQDDIDTLKQLLAGKPNVNVRDGNTDTTALEHAVLNANREMVQLLLWSGADVNARDSNGRTPIMLLGDKITSDTVWDLINAGAKVNLRDEDGDTALIDAASSNNLEVLKALLDAGAKVNARNNEGRSALMQAASEGLVNNVRTLILAGADVNARDVKGNTAWAFAVENEHTPVLRLLRSYGADELIATAQERKQ